MRKGARTNPAKDTLKKKRRKRGARRGASGIFSKKRGGGGGKGNNDLASDYFEPPIGFSMRLGKKKKGGKAVAGVCMRLLRRSVPADRGEKKKKGGSRQMNASGGLAKGRKPGYSYPLSSPSGADPKKKRKGCQPSTASASARGGPQRKEGARFCVDAGIQRKKEGGAVDLYSFG